MENFSNETNINRRKAVIKVVLKRYSFVIWFLLVLYFLNSIGEIFLSMSCNNNEFSFIVKILCGMLTIIVISIVFFCIGWMLRETITTIANVIFALAKYIRRKTVLKDCRDIFCKMLKIFKSIPKLLQKIYKRIKEEKELFKNAVEKQMEREKM